MQIVVYYITISVIDSLNGLCAVDAANISNLENMASAEDALKPQQIFSMLLSL